MSFKKQLNSKVTRIIQSEGRSAPVQRRGAAGRVSASDLGADLSMLSEEMLKKVAPTAVGYAATIVRKRAFMKVRAGGSATVIGRSRTTKTRGVPASNPSGGQYMKNVGRGSWGKSVWGKRGTTGKSLADPGGIIKKPISRKGGGMMASQIVGPKYEPGREGKNFAHTHEPKQGQSSGAPGHKWWGKKGRPLKKRPFIGPAGKETIVEQMGAVKRALARWDIDESEINA